MSHYTLDDERYGFYYHQGCFINFEYCRINRVYNGCKECPKYDNKRQVK